MNHALLRHAIFSLIFALSSLSLHSQWVSIPDTNFGTWLNTNGVDTCLRGNSQIGWEMDTTCPAVVGKSFVYCTHKNIADLEGIQYFDSLQSLDCSNNLLSALPTLPLTLVALNCVDNRINSLPTLPNSLKHLDCSLNLLTALPILPDLTFLSCSFNQITILPVLPNNLLHLSFGDNTVAYLPNLPDSLSFLDCANNPLTNLPPFPARLRDVGCDGIQISTLPTLPNGIISMSCDNNLLTALPFLPTTLKYLSCANNQITSLPILPSDLNVLKCSLNQIATLPELPDSLYNCFLDNNPLNCLPRIKRIVWLSFSNTNITCLPNYGNITNSTPTLNSLSLCSTGNPNGCAVYWNISGKTYHDSYSNCLIDAHDTALLNIKVSLMSSGVSVNQTFTGGTGFFSFDSDTFGIYEVSASVGDMPFVVSCPVNNLYTDTINAVDSSTYNNFAFECEQSFDLAAHSIYGWRFRPTEFTTVGIAAGDVANFYGVHCATGVSGTVTITINGLVTFISPAPGGLTPMVSGNVLTYNIADFGAVDFNYDFNIIVQTDTNAALGSLVCFIVSVTPSSGDNNPANNTLTHCFTVVGSFDPNDKQVYPAGNTDTSQHWLSYTIRFQNTGTDTAIHIYIADTLDSDLDASTFQLLAYSHPPTVQIKQNEVRFNFPNIMLVDSHANEPLSHGYVQYKIKLKDNLPIGSEINNTAFIYFDFNAPVVTNTTTNTIAVVTGVGDARHKTQDFRLFPNPASDAVTISVDGSMVGSVATVTDVTGRKIAGVQLTTNNQQLATSAFESGVYFITLTDKQGRSTTKKLVVSR